MPKNALLLRWKGGFTTKTDSGSVSTYGRREGFLSAATVDSAASISQAGTTALSLFATPRTSISATHEPASDAEAPYTGYAPGHTLTAPNSSGTPTTMRVEGLTVTEDDNGYLTYTAEMTNLVETERRRQQLWLQRVGNGTLAGRSAAASLLETVDPQTTGGRLATRDVAFSKGVLEVSTSPSLLIAKSSRITMIQATVVPGATNPCITFQILRNGSALSFAAVGGSPATSFNLTPSVPRLVLLPGSADLVVSESDTISIGLTAVASDANLFGVTATLADGVF